MRAGRQGHPAGVRGAAHIEALVVRFDGNAAAEGLQILAAANNPNLHVEGTMEQAAAEAARLAANAKASKEAKQ